MSKQILVDYIPFEISPEQINESIKNNGKLVVKGVKFLLLNDDEITSILPDGVEVAAYVG